MHLKGKRVFLVSGVYTYVPACRVMMDGACRIIQGFRQLIEPVAAKLQISSGNIYANVFMFPDDASTRTTAFDTTQPTSETGGKAKVIAMLKEKYGLSTIVMVGDGVTDMEARPPAAVFIGYGGVVTRPVVKACADLFITDFQVLIDELK